MHRDSRLYLDDILGAIDHIREYNLGLDYEAFQRDRKTNLIFSRVISRIKGSRKNKLVILGVEALGRQGVKSPECLDIPRFCNAAGRDASASKMVSYF